MDEVNETPPQKIGGWLLVLAALLIAWGPLQLAVAVSSALPALEIRGLPLGLLMVARIVVVAFGVAAGTALVTQQGTALTMVRASLVLSLAMDLFVYATPYFPSNRVPGDTVLYVAGSVAYCAAWLIYLARSARVRRTLA